VFGQVGLIDGRQRSASCVMRHKGVLLEMQQPACARLLESQSVMALKFLAAMNQGLIAALRRADRRLVRLQDDSQPTSALDLPIMAEPIPSREHVAGAKRRVRVPVTGHVGDGRLPHPAAVDGRLTAPALAPDTG
jgi:hypothetical protein